MSRFAEDNYALIYSRQGKTCPDIKTAMNLAHLNQQLILNSKQWFKIQGQVDAILDCEGRDTIQNIRDTKFYQIELDWDVDRVAHPVFEAYAHGTAVSSGGVAANKIFSFTEDIAVNASSKLGITINGRYAESANLPMNLTNQSLQNFLDNTEIIGKGNTLVAGNGPFTIEFQNDLGKSNSINLSILTGARYVVNLSQSGNAKICTMGEVLGELKTFDLIICDKSASSRGVSGTFLLHNCAIDTRTISCPLTGRVTRRDVLVIRSVERLNNYLPPACENPKRLRAAKTFLKVGAGFRNEAADIVDIYSNNLIKDNEAFGRSGGLVSQWETNKPVSTIRVTYKGDYNHDQFLKLEDAQSSDDVVRERVELYLNAPAYQEVITRFGAAVSGDPDISFEGDAKRSRFTVEYTTTLDPATGIREAIEFYNIEQTDLLATSV